MSSRDSSFMDQEKRSNSLLSPYRALDLTDEKGLLCGKILADLGADVIKIEKPGGDPTRSIGPFYRDLPHPQKSLFWFAYNTSKRGMTLNVETLEGREIFKRLAATAHFVLESFPPGYMDKLGLGYSTLKKLNPQLILTSITPFGQTGPYKDYKTSDIVALAMGGLMNLNGDPDRPPLRFSVEQAYLQAGAQAAAGTMIAHHYRQLTGIGQWVDVSLQECIVSTLWLEQHFWDISQEILRREGVRTPRGQIAIRILFPCQDGFISWRIFVAMQGAKTRALVKWMEEEGRAGELSRVEWEAIDMDKISQPELDAWEETFGRFFLTHTKAELYEEAVKRGIMLFPLNTIGDLLPDPQLSARDFWEEIPHPELGASLVYPGAPFKSDEAPWGVRRRAPLIGEHNHEIYEGELGFTGEELLLLKKGNIV